MPLWCMCAVVYNTPWIDQNVRVFAYARGSAPQPRRPLHTHHADGRQPDLQALPHSRLHEPRVCIHSSLLPPHSRLPRGCPSFSPPLMSWSCFGGNSRQPRSYFVSLLSSSTPVFPPALPPCFQLRGEHVDAAAHLQRALPGGAVRQKGRHARAALGSLSTFEGGRAFLVVLFFTSA